MVSGAIGVFSFAPFYLWPLAIISLVALFALWSQASSPKQAAVIGFLWALGLFLAGVSWIYVALHVYGAMPAPMAAVAILLFCCMLSLFPALAGWWQARLNVSNTVKLLVIMPAFFVGAEYVRGWIMTGFPWLTFGYAQTPSPFGVAPLSGYAPIVGAYGISWLLALTAGAIVLASAKLSGIIATANKRGLGIAGLSIWIGGLLLGAVEWSTPSGAPLPVSLTQGNIEQHLKFREDQFQATIDNYLDLVAHSRGKLIVLPETALPLLLNDLPAEVKMALQQKARANQGDVLLGAAYVGESKDVSQEFAYYNGAVSIGAAPMQRYAKSHLVAFGEFPPPFFSWVYQWLQMPMSGFTPGAETQAPMRLSGHLIAVNICYEDAFGRDVTRPLPEAELLVNISNMAWYGRSLAADQHAQFSQMRALETARWMLRSTNTGVTAAIDEKGRIVKALPQFTRGVLEVEAVPMQGTTPYSRWRDWPVLVGLFGVLGWALTKHRAATVNR